MEEGNATLIFDLNDCFVCFGALKKFVMLYAAQMTVAYLRTLLPLYGFYIYSALISNISNCCIFMVDVLDGFVLLISLKEVRFGVSNPFIHIKPCE